MNEPKRPVLGEYRCKGCGFNVSKSVRKRWRLLSREGLFHWAEGANEWCGPVVPVEESEEGR